MDNEEQSKTEDHMDLTQLSDIDASGGGGDDPLSDRGGHETSVETEINYDLSENVAHDLINYVRSNTIRNEQQFLLVTLGYLTGYFRSIDHYVSGVIIGTSSSGKTHVQNKVEDLFKKEHMYQATTGSDKSLIYDGEWDNSYIASLDELQKPSDTLIEFLKSVHSDDEQFEYKLTPDSAEKREAEEVETIIRSAKPYWFLYAQTDSDFEMWNRLMKIPVHESESKNKAVFRMAFDEHHIQIGDSEEDYGYDFDVGTKALQAHIASIPEAIESGEIPGHVFLPNNYDEFGWKVSDVVEPIFNHARSESNRVYDMVANVIRASALLNYKDREVRYLDEPNHQDGEYIIAEPQDVANVLACRESLLASTHELDDKKRKICAAIDNNTGASNEADMAAIVDGLQSTDMSMLTRTELRKNLEKLHENYLVEINQGAADGGNADTYQFHGWGELGFANVFDFEEMFDECFDPISGTNFLVSHEEQRSALQDSGQDLTQGADAQVTSNTGGQQTLGGGGGGRDLVLEPHEETVRTYLRNTLDGVRVTGLDDLPVEAMLGLTSVENPDPSVDISDSPLDPTAGCWYQPDKPDDWIENEQDARRAVKDAIRMLVEERILIYDDVHEVNKANEPVDVTFAVLGSADI